MNLDHPNIIKFYDYFVFGHLLIVILDYFECGSLESVILSSGKLSTSITAKYSHDIATGLQQCLIQNISHRDVKPGNVLISSQGNAILADFDLASFSSKEHEACGSLLFCAPEVLNHSHYDPFKSDIFSFGVTIYMMLNGVLPWTLDDVFLQHRPVPNYENIEEPWKFLIMRMLNENPVFRPDIQEVLEFTAAVIQKNRITHQNSGIHYRVFSPTRRNSNCYLTRGIRRRKTISTLHTMKVKCQSSGPHRETPWSSGSIPLTFSLMN